jgi:vacuolar protein sorting-associated protein 13A/C
MQKLVLKIIDNIQIEIKNIHIRFEDTISNSYSWGIALHRIEIFTTDKDWNR